jgi:hypothetical protein
MNTKEQLRENILETNYFLTQALMKEDIKSIERLRAELSNLFDLYEKELNK